VAGVELWWLGQAGFRLRDPDSGGATVFCDPFFSPHDDRPWSAPASAADLAVADVVLVSHEHIDHRDLPTLDAAAAQPGARHTLIVPRPLEATVSAPRVIGAQPGEALQFGGVRIWPVPARHGVDVADAYNFGHELSNGLYRYLGYVVEIGGVRVYHSGDCSPYDGQADVVRALAPQIALLPINGRDYFRETEHNIVGNMDYREAARLAHDIGVQVLVPMHWELFPTNRGYPYELVRYCEEHYPALSVLVMGRGARLTLALEESPRGD
jgi:L-ascorbate metabolism protein UlaG (beta-lactamase superfamily)